MHEPETLRAALEGADVAIYLVHSLDDPDFERKDADAARAFGRAAAEAGVRQIVYMGGLGADDGNLSAHLRSRREVEGLLGEAGVPVTVLRAAIVVGAGGISWELTRQLVKNLPAMVVPRWVATRTQPIALDDVVRYLAGVVGREEAFGRVFEIGGPDQLTYLEMLQVAAEIINGRKVPIIRVPVLTPRLSSYWLALVTDVDVTTGRNLIDSMGTEVLVTDHAIQDVVPGEPLTYAGGGAPGGRARPDRGLRQGGAARRSAAAGTASRATRCTWVRIGPRMPPEARRCSPTTRPSSDRGEAQHHVAGGQRRDRVGHAW